MFLGEVQDSLPANVHLTVVYSAMAWMDNAFALQCEGLKPAALILN